MSTIRVEQEIFRATDEQEFAYTVQQRAIEAWREYLRSQGVPPYPKVDHEVEASRIELHFHIA